MLPPIAVGGARGGRDAPLRGLLARGLVQGRRVGVGPVASEELLVPAPRLGEEFLLLNARRVGLLDPQACLGQHSDQRRALHALRARGGPVGVLRARSRASRKNSIASMSGCSAMVARTSSRGPFTSLATSRTAGSACRIQ